MKPRSRAAVSLLLAAMLVAESGLAHLAHDHGAHLHRGPELHLHGGDEALAAGRHQAATAACCCAGHSHAAEANSPSAQAAEPSPGGHHHDCAACRFFGLTATLCRSAGELPPAAVVWDGNGAARVLPPAAPLGSYHSRAPPRLV